MRSISIVLCTFNGGRFLDEQLRSLRQQAGVQEIVAVDDHSTDDTMAILQQHAAEDRRVRVYWNADRLGVVANFERAISLASGEWIGLSDQDDIWVPTKLARLQAAWDGTAGLLHHATRKFHDQPPRRLPARAGETRKFCGRDARRLLHRNTIVGHTTLVRADVVRRLRPFPADVPHDWWIGMGAALLGPVQYVDEFLVHYRIHATNAYHSAGSRLRRIRSEHQLRLALLDALDRRTDLAIRLRPLVREYRELLRGAERVRFSWALERFYWRNAALFFGDGRSPLGVVRRLRKSVAASLGATGQGAAERASGGGVFGELGGARRAGWRAGLGMVAVSAAALAVSLGFWVFRAEAATSRTVARQEMVAEATSRSPAVEAGRVAAATVAPEERERAEWRLPPTLRPAGAWRMARHGGPPAGPEFSGRLHFRGPRDPAMLYLARHLPGPRWSRPGGPGTMVAMGDPRPRPWFAMLRRPPGMPLPGLGMMLLPTINGEAPPRPPRAMRYF